MKGILFSTPMVQALLDGRKTQTRREIKSRHESGLFQICRNKSGQITDINSLDWDERNCEKDIVPRYKKGDVLYVRETYQHTKCLNINPEDENYGYIYKADGNEWGNIEGWKWKPSLFMPKEAARIFLQVIDVRVERLGDITEQDCIAEGVEMDEPKQISEEEMAELIEEKGAILDPDTITFRDYSINEDDNEGYNYCLTGKESYQSLWLSINKSYNPDTWVWVYEFERIIYKKCPLQECNLLTNRQQFFLATVIDCANVR